MGVEFGMLLGRIGEDMEREMIAQAEYLPSVIELVHTTTLNI